MSPPNKSTAVGMSFLTVGGLLVALYPMRVDIDAHLAALPPRVYDGGLTIGLVLCLVGLILVVVGVLQRLAVLSSQMKRVREYLATLLSDPRFEHVPATEDQFEAVFEYSQEEFQGEIEAEVKQRMRQWHAKNPEYLWVIQRVVKAGGAEKRRLVGFFSLFPLKKQATKRCDRGELFGAQISVDDILRPGATPAGVYIGAIAGRGKLAQGVAIGALMERLNTLLKRGGAVYTRPVTEIGLRRVRKYGFVPVRPDVDEQDWKTVHKLVRPSVAEMLGPRMDRRKARQERSLSGAKRADEGTRAISQFPPEGAVGSLPGS